ncbi:MAG: FAD binding domain-containing protein [Anaerolineales bacterium]|jgi:carbon-monoxide dehydrogenase medium subunit
MNAYPKLPEFDYIKPDSYQEASQFLASHAGEARPFIGGTDLFVQMRDRTCKPKYLVDIKGLEGMDLITFDQARGLTIGAGVNMNRVIADADIRDRYRLLADAAESVASYQLRSRASIVGNICNASPAGDTIGACLLLDGVLNVFGESGERQEPLKTFFLGPGKTRLQPGDIVTAIHFPLPPNNMKGSYIKLGRNQLSDLAIVGVTALGYPESSVESGYWFKLALASVAPIPLVVDRVGEIMGHDPISEASLQQAAGAAMDTCTPIDDVRGSARYRKIMVRNLSYKALKDVWGQLSED